jgi:hypothetical protein
MTIWKWLNNKRLRDYPRLVLIASGIVIILNIILSHGWIGGLTGLLMWGDFIDYYSAGILYKTNIAQLYNPAVQELTERNLIAPSNPPGVSFYSYPPHSAQLNTIFSFVSLPISLIFWCLISICCVILVAKFMHRFLIPGWLDQAGLSSTQLSIIIFSSFAFTEGFVTGQMHTFILLLVVALLYATMKEKWFLAGLLAALLAYKPQLVIGFLLLWLVWKKFYPILVFVLFSLIWQGAVLITKGINPYIDYFSFIKNITYLPYVKEGFPLGIQSTPYTLVASMLPIKYASLWNLLFIGIAFVIIILFGLLIYKARKLPMAKQNIILSMAILLPLIVTPYAILHDLLLLFPIMILLAIDHQGDKWLLLISIILYVAMLLLPLLSIPVKIALTGLIPTAVFIYIVQSSLRLLRTEFLIKI